MKKEISYFRQIAILIILAVTIRFTWAATQTINTIPSADATFIATLQTFLGNELANYMHIRFGNEVAIGGLGPTDASLTHTISAIVAFPNGFYVSQAATSHTYTATKRTFVYVRDSDSRTITIGGAAITYDTNLVFAETTAATVLPATPTGCIPLFYADTDGTSITAVTDLRSGSLPVEYFDDLEDAVDNAGANQTILVSQQIRTGTKTVTQRIEVISGGRIIIDNGGTLTISGSFSSLLEKQIFDVSEGGTLVLPPGLKINALWFGTTGAAVLSAITAGSTSGTYVYIPAKATTYSSSSTWDLTALTKNITLIGEQGYQNSADTGTELEWTQTDGTNGIEWGGNGYRLHIENLKIIGNASAGSGLYSTAASADAYINNVEIKNWGVDGMHAENLFSSQILAVNFLNNDNYNLYFDSCNKNYVRGRLPDGTVGGIYLTASNKNWIDVDIDNPEGNYGVYVDDDSYGNRLEIWVDGTTEKAAYFSANTYRNFISINSGTTRGVIDLGIDNDIDGVPDRANSSTTIQSFGPLINRIRNSSGVGTGGWSGLTTAAETTMGGSNGTSFKVTIPQSTGATAAWTQNLDTRPTYANGDIFVVRFLAKTSRALAVTESLYAGISGLGTAFPSDGAYSFDATTSWRSFYFVARCDGTPVTPAIYFKGWDIGATTLYLYITDITVVLNPGIPGRLVPTIFSGNNAANITGDNGYYYPESPVPLLATNQLALLSAAPYNPRPGMIAHADGWIWDPLSTATDASYFVYYGTLAARTATYKWTASGGGTNEYYCELTGGGDPSISDPDEVYINGASATEGTAGSLNAGEWDYGNNDALGYNTIYVRLSDGTDPDSKNLGYVQARRWTKFTEASAK